MHDGLHSLRVAPHPMLVFRRSSRWKSKTRLRANPNRRSRSASPDGRPTAWTRRQLDLENGTPLNQSNDGSSHSCQGCTSGSGDSSRAADHPNEDDDGAPLELETSISTLVVSKQL